MKGPGGCYNQPMSKNFVDQDILLCRELRWHTRGELRERCQSAILTATLRVPHGLRQGDQALQAFEKLCASFGGEIAAAGGRLILRTGDADGPAMHWAVPDAMAAKKLAIAREEAPGGELLDLDVMDAQGAPISRIDMGADPRPCLLCGARPAALCVRGKRHTAEETERAFLSALSAVSKDIDLAAAIADLAQRALIYEVMLSPKPGLVDRQSAGSHQDMDIYRFIDSAVCLHPFFERFAKAGMDPAVPAEDLLSALRPIGIEAEKAMMQVTGGANTHRGAIFSLGILCASVARLGKGADADTICDLAGQIAWPALRDEPTRSHGNLTRRLYGAPGARGEAARGFPSARSALKCLEDALHQGVSREKAQLMALYHIMGELQDSNLLYRGGLGGLHFVQENAKRLLQEGLPQAGMAAFSAEMDRRRLSPGGAADVLAQALFLYLLKETV